MMSSLLLRKILRTSRFPSAFLCQNRSYQDLSKNPSKTYKPLRILFCGSDNFSVASLKALQIESKLDPDFIKSIDVLVRPPKRVGRGMKTIQRVPLHNAAADLGLTIHQRDTFSDWDLPTPDGESINLIIAVSFGLFVPPRIIRAAEYGGLNVHPSLLPNYRGSAPLQRMIMYGAKRGGITLQTLDTKKFDHGVILAQRPVHFPRPSSITYPELLEHMTPLAAQLLLGGLQDRVYIPPLIDVGKGTYEDQLPPDMLVHAPKISKEDRLVNWQRYEAATRIDRRHRALGPMYSMIYVDEHVEKRFVFHDFEVVEHPKAIEKMAWEWRTGRWFMNNKQQSISDTDISSDADGHLHSDTPDHLKTDEESLEAWRTSEEYRPDQTEDEKFKSWLAYREKQLARKSEKPVKQNVYHFVEKLNNDDLVPVFYVDDGDAIIVSVKGAGLRIVEITVEGDERRPAAAAMKRHRKRGMWKLRQKTQRNGIDKWFAEYNPRFVDTFSREKYLQTLSPEKREDEEDKDLWFLIKEEERIEAALLADSLASAQRAKYLEGRKRSERILEEKKVAAKRRAELKEQERLQKIEEDSLRREEEKFKKEREQIKEDLKKDDWSDLLLERHREFFPEALAEARKERAKEREEKLRQEAKELQRAKDESDVTVAAQDPPADSKN